MIKLFTDLDSSWHGMVWACLGVTTVDVQFQVKPRTPSGIIKQWLLSFCLWALSQGPPAIHPRILCFFTLSLSHGLAQFPPLPPTAQGLARPLAYSCCISFTFPPHLLYLFHFLKHPSNAQLLFFPVGPFAWAKWWWSLIRSLLIVLSQHTIAWLTAVVKAEPVKNRKIKWGQRRWHCGNERLSAKETVSPQNALLKCWPSPFLALADSALGWGHTTSIMPYFLNLFRMWS